MFAACCVMPHRVLPNTTKLLPGFLQTVSLVCIICSFFNICLWFGVRRLTNSNSFKRFVVYSLIQIQNNESIVHAGYPSLMSMLVRYLVLLVLGMAACMLDLNRRAAFVVSFGMLQPVMSLWLVCFLNIVDLVGRAPAASLLSIIQKQKNNFKRQEGSGSDSGEASSF